MKNVFTNMINEKKRYRQFKEDVAALPKPYAEVITALEKYIWGFAKNGELIKALEELLHIFQEGAAEGIPVANIVGDDPVRFADDIMAQYPDELWLIKSQNQLRKQVKEVTDDESN